MPFDTSRWNEPATRLELANACAAAAQGMHALIAAMNAIRHGEIDKADDELADAFAHSNKLEALFDQLTGYRPSEPIDE